MKRTLFSLTASLLAASLLLSVGASRGAEEGVLRYPSDSPIDVCPQEVVGYETLAVLDFTDAKTTLDGWQSKPGTKLDRKDKTLLVTSSDEDPYFFSPMLPSFMSEEQLQKAVGKTLVKIRVRPNLQGKGQIFVATQDEPGYSEKNSIMFDLPKIGEWGECVVPLEIKSVPLRLRFDLGGDSGTAEVEKIELIRVQYKPIKFSTFEISDGTLNYNLSNNNIVPEIADTTVYGAHPRKSYPGASLEVSPADGVVKDLYFPQTRPFEEIEVAATARSTKEAFSRRFFAFNESVADKAAGAELPTLKNDRVEVRFASDASGAEIFLDGKRVAVVTPLIVEEGDGAAILPDRTDFSKVDLTAKPGAQDADKPATRLTPVFRSVDGDSVSFYLTRTPIQKAREQLNAVAKATTDVDPWAKKEGAKGAEAKRAVDPSSVCGSLQFRLEGNILSFDFDAPCLVNAPVVRVLGEMRQAILSGSEYLESGEHSSSTADIETTEHVRYAQPIDWTTAPFASIVTDRCSASLLYDDPKAQSIFAVPDFIDGDAASSRFNICAKQGSGKIRIESSEEPIEQAILWSVKTRGLPDLPVSPRAGREQAEYILKGFEESCLKTPIGWSHATVGANPPYMFKPSYGSDFVSTIWEITGKLPEIPRLDFGGGHISNYVSLLLMNGGEPLAEHLSSVAAGLMKSQQDDGSWRYSGKYLYGAQYNYASGDCGNHLYSLMESWRLTKDDAILPAVKKGLDFVNKLKTPAGAQTWELSVHTPDIMGASRCVLANVMYYEATGEKEYLEAAVRWALTGIPFVYLWEDPDLTPGEQPMMRYATIAVFGATGWASPNWMGRPVQWCGLDYAHALILLAKHDDTLDWAKIAEGIVASAECQLMEEGKFVGLLPDSFNLINQHKNGAYINPSVVWLLRQMLEGNPTNVSIVDCAGRRVVSPFPAKAEGKTVKIAGVKGMKYQIMIDGKEVREIESQGEDSIEF